MFNEDHEITDPAIIKTLFDKAMGMIPHTDVRDPNGVLSGINEPAEGEPVTGYRFYRVNEDGERYSGVFNRPIPPLDEIEDIGHFWFNKEYAKAYMLEAIKNDIANHREAAQYQLERVNGLYKGISHDEGFLMTDIDRIRTLILSVNKSDIDIIRNQ